MSFTLKIYLHHINPCFLYYTVPPEIVKREVSSLLIISVPSHQFETTQNITVTVGQNIMIPETYTLKIECLIHRANPAPSISWFHDDETIESGLPPYIIQSDGTLVIEGIVRGRDDGIYTCVADTSNIGTDESSSTVIVTGKKLHKMQQGDSCVL